MHLDDA